MRNSNYLHDVPSTAEDAAGVEPRAPGKRTLTMGLPGRAAQVGLVQRKVAFAERDATPEAIDAAAARGATTPTIDRLMDEALRPDLFARSVQLRGDGIDAPPDDVHVAATHGTSGAGGPLPFLDTIQPLFGRHGIAHIVAHQDNRAREGARSMGAEAFATGDRVGFAGTPSLHTVAHEAAHVVQQRAGVQLAGGVGDAGDRYEQHADAVADRVVRGESVESLLDSLAGPLSGAAPRGPGALVQRIVHINQQNVLPENHNATVTYCRDLVVGAGLLWTDAMTAVLRGWLADRNSIVAAADAAVLAYNAYHHTGGAPAAWEHGQTSTPIGQAQMEQAHHLRNRERFASLMVLSDTQTGARVPGLGKIPDEELLRLAHHDRPEEQFWMRPSTNTDEIRNVKRSRISAEDEAHITAAGNPSDPSYVVSAESRHLGHRYVGANQEFITGDKHKRTYGSKKKREGYEWKASGMVDGHAIQVQDDQPILGPYQQDAPHWKTTVSTTSGAPVTYSNTTFLPEDASDERWIETHPDAFYEENQEQGKHVRQSAIETPAMKNRTSFLHYNRYGTTTVKPNAGKARHHLYPVADRCEYLINEPNSASLSATSAAVASPTTTATTTTAASPPTAATTTTVASPPTAATTTTAASPPTAATTTTAASPPTAATTTTVASPPAAATTTAATTTAATTAAPLAPPLAPSRKRKHVSLDNRPIADYSKPDDFDPATLCYPDVPGGKPSAGKNRTLGNISAEDHLAMSTLPDISKFPFSTVLRPESQSFEFAPDFRLTEPGYASPPPSPHYEPSGLEVQDTTEAGDLSQKKHFHHNGGLVTSATHDASHDSTNLSITKMRTADPTSWTGGTAAFAVLLARKAAHKSTAPSPDTNATASPSTPAPSTIVAAPSTTVTAPTLLTTPTAPLRPPTTAKATPPTTTKITPSTTSAANGTTAAALSSLGTTTGGSATTAPPGKLPSPDEQRQLHRTLGATINGLIASLGHSTELVRLLAIEQRRAAISADDPTQAQLLDDAFGDAHQWFIDNCAALVRPRIIGARGDAAARSPFGERLPALRQFFNECGQMAVHHVLELDAGTPGNDAELTARGGFVENIDENAVRHMLAAAGRPDLPVIAGHQQLQDLIVLVQTHQDQRLADNMIEPNEIRGLHTVDEFMRGGRDVMHVVLNTSGHIDEGHHWIAATVRRVDGQISISYKDSLAAPADYSDLFTALRDFLGGVPAQPAPHLQPNKLALPRPVTTAITTTPSTATPVPPTATTMPATVTTMPPAVTTVPSTNTSSPAPATTVTLPPDNHR